MEMVRRIVMGYNADKSSLLLVEKISKQNVGHIRLLSYSALDIRSRVVLNCNFIPRSVTPRLIRSRTAIVHLPTSSSGGPVISDLRDALGYEFPKGLSEDRQGS